MLDINEYKPGGQCKSLKSTSRLFDLGSDLESDLGSVSVSDLVTLGALGTLQKFKYIIYVISCICVFMNLYLCIFVFDSWEYQFRFP